MAKANLNTYYQTALDLHKSGKLKEAKKLYKELLKMYPKLIDVKLMLGRLLYREGDLTGALQQFEEGYRLKPLHLELLLELAQAHLKLGNQVQAEHLLEEGAAKAGHQHIYLNLGIIKSLLGKFGDAVEVFGHVKEGALMNDKAFFHLAKAHVALGNFEEGSRNYLHCLELNEKHKGALNNLANLYQMQGQYRMTVDHYQTLLKYYPNESMVLNNLGGLFEKMGEIDRAEKCYQRAISISPELTIAFYNLAHLLAKRRANHAGALEVCEKGMPLANEPFKTALRYQQIISKQQVNDWSTFEQDLLDLTDILERYADTDEVGFEIIPFDLSFSSIDGALYRKVAEKHAKNLIGKVSRHFSKTSYNHSLSRGKIKVGYYSSELRNHPGGYLVRKLFDLHDSSQFEIHVFSLLDANDQTHQEIRETADYFHDVSKLPSAEIADLINRTGVDILVALAGYNSFMKMDVLALRPAPIQMMLVGSHETTGSPFIDYVFSDTYMMDTELRKNYSEQVITLPVSLMVNSPLPKLTSKKTSRIDHGLKEDAFVFASFNHPKKIDPQAFDCWSQILSKVKDSILWIYDGGSVANRRNLLKNAKSRGIEEAQIVFAPPLPIEQHWERISYADLFLDTFVCNAHFTCLEILRSGKPIITLRGKSHNSRLCASMLHFAQLDVLIAQTEHAFIECAIKLAKNPQLLKAVQGQLGDVNSPLFDSELQVKFLEKAFRMVIHQFKENGQYKDLIVKSSLKFDSL